MAAALVLLPTLTLTSFQAATADPQPAPRQSAGRESGTPSRPASDSMLSGEEDVEVAPLLDGATAPSTGSSSAESIDYWKRKAAKRLRLLAARERRIVALLKKVRGGDARSNGTGVSGGVRGAICSAFGAHCSEAIAVARCESGLNVYARNGQYLGLFQEGEYARATFGFAWNALAQARSAYRYFIASGSDWSPWTCRA